MWLTTRPRPRTWLIASWSAALMLLSSVAFGSESAPEPTRLDFAAGGTSVVARLGEYCVPDVAGRSVCSDNERPRGSERALPTRPGGLMTVRPGARAEAIRVRLFRRSRAQNTEEVVGPVLQARRVSPTEDVWRVRLPTQNYGASIIDARVEYPGDHYAQFSASLRSPRRSG